MEDKLLSLIKCFKFEGNIVDAHAFGTGHINKTYRVLTIKDEYILQQINNYAFKDVDGLMNNIDIVTSFIKNRGNETLEVISTHDNKLYAFLDKEYYRMFRFIKSTITYETVGKDLSLAEKLGDAFGKFHHLLSDLDASKLSETIPNFHNTPSRYLDFSQAYVHANLKLRADANDEAEFIFALLFLTASYARVSSSSGISGISSALRMNEDSSSVSENPESSKSIFLFS